MELAKKDCFPGLQTQLVTAIGNLKVALYSSYMYVWYIHCQLYILCLSWYCHCYTVVVKVLYIVVHVSYCHVSLSAILSLSSSYPVSCVSCVCCAYKLTKSSFLRGVIHFFSNLSSTLRITSSYCRRLLHTSTTLAMRCLEPECVSWLLLWVQFLSSSQMQSL